MRRLRYKDRMQEELYGSASGTSPKLVPVPHALSAHAHTGHPDKAKKKKKTQQTSDYASPNPPPKAPLGRRGGWRLGRRGLAIEGRREVARWGRLEEEGNIGFGVQRDLLLSVFYGGERGGGGSF